MVAEPRLLLHGRRDCDQAAEYWNRDLLIGGAESSEWKVRSRELRKTLCQNCQERGLQSSRTETAVRARDQTRIFSVEFELSTAGSTACQQTMSTQEEQMTMANQQLNVQLQQFLETLETILWSTRMELEEQVQNATSTNTHKDPMIRTDRLFKLRSHVGTVDQRNELELIFTEESSTPRLIRELRMLMCNILVMMKTLYKCRYADVNEGFAARRQFVRERDNVWTPEERVVLRTQRRRECAKNGGRASRSLFHQGKQRNRELYASAKGEPRDHENTTIHWQQSYAADRCAAEEQRQKQAWQGCMEENRLRKWKTTSRESVITTGRQGREKSRSKTRLKDLADAEWKPVTANTRPSSTATDAPVEDDYATMFLVTVPHDKRETPCARVKIETTMRSGAGSTAPTGSGRVWLTFVIPTCETCLMTDTCTGGGICPRRYQTARGCNGGNNSIRDGTEWFSAWKCGWGAFREP